MYVSGYVTNNSGHKITSGTIHLSACNKNGKLMLVPTTEKVVAYWITGSIPALEPGETGYVEADGTVPENVAAVKYVDVKYYVEE